MNMAARPALVIDCHALLGTGKTWADPEREVEYSAQILLERGAQAGIDRHCVLPPRNGSYVESNRQVARLCERHEGKLIGFAAHSPQREAGRLRETLAGEVNALGLRGVRSDGHPTRELLDAALELGIPVMYAPAPPRGQGVARFFHMPAASYPKVNFILPHLGNYRSLSWPAHMEAIDLAKRYPNVYLETSGVGSFKYLEIAARELPPEKLLFGTCAPELDPRVEIEALRLLKLSRDHHAKVAGGNILRLLGGGRPSGRQ
jgi:predicted TIM-barrel fold metal-dependent hydrolase